MAFERSRSQQVARIAILGLVAVSLTACGTTKRLLGRDDKSVAAASAPATAIGVNSYLWRASLATLSRMKVTLSSGRRTLKFSLVKPGLAISSPARIACRMASDCAGPMPSRRCT